MEEILKEKENGMEEGKKWSGTENGRNWENKGGGGNDREQGKWKKIKVMENGKWGGKKLKEKNEKNRGRKFDGMEQVENGKRKCKK